MSAVEEQIDSALIAALKTIRVGDGYRTDIGLRVQPFEFDPDVNLPAESAVDDYLWLDSGESAEKSPTEPLWTYALGVTVAINADRQTELSAARAQAWRVLQDVEAVIASDTTLDWTAVRARVTAKAVPRRTAGSNYLIATCRLAIDYVDSNYPYTLQQ